MAVELPEAHGRSMDSTRRYVAGIKDDQWDGPTPCDDWNVRELLNHLVSGNFWVAPLMGGKTIEEVGDRYDGDMLGDDPMAAYDQSAKEADAVVRTPGAMEASCAVSYGPVPGEVYAGHRFIDVLIHGWDLAKATGQDTALDPELVEACWAVVEPQKDLLAGSGAFGGDHDIPPGASRQVQLLAVLGRKE
jgi:uncharacterized protein (TIGR03086 family)